MYGRRYRRAKRSGVLGLFLMGALALPVAAVIQLLKVTPEVVLVLGSVVVVLGGLFWLGLKSSP